VEVQKGIEVYNGDCLDIMKNIPSGSVDLILQDPPFNTTQCKWEWDIMTKIDELWAEWNRIIKPNGAIVMFGAEPFSSKLRVSNLKDYKYDWYWRKPKGTGHLNAKKQPMRDTENIMVFYQKQCNYYPQKSEGEPYGNKSGKTTKVREAGHTTYGKFKDGETFRTINDGFRLPKQGIDFGVVERGTLHQTQKPVEILEYLIKTYTSEGETVFDGFMGSGSTIVACKNTNRVGVGIELDENYFNIAKERLNGNT
jgi:DNA modification methylase